MTWNQWITKLASALGAGVLLFPSLAMSKAEPVSMARQGKWVVNYDDDSCHLMGAFGTGKDEIIMRLSRYEPGDGFVLTLYGQSLRTLEASSSVKLAFSPTVKLHYLESMNGLAGKVPMVILGGTSDFLDRPSPDDGFELPRITPEQEAKVTGLTYQFEHHNLVRLEFGSMASPLKAMRECNADLVKFWGLDPVVQEKLTVTPKPKTSPGTWLDPDDYPYEPLREGKGGYVRFRLEVDEKGAVSGCHIQLKMKQPEFDKLTCELISKRAYFSPAIDAAGKPTKSYFVEAVRWVIQ